MNAFTIKDLENLSGVKAHTIRIWEQRYSFLKPRRTKTNIRYYSCEELKAILNIALLNKYGFKISHIDRMCSKELEQKIISLTHAPAQQERLLNELLHCMVDLDTQKFDDVLSAQISIRGIEKTITQIIFPFLEKIGILWITNNINPAQEHLVTNIIRQKLMVGIDNCCKPANPSKRALLFLPEGEYHELALLFIHFLLKVNGVEVLYLGANVPLRDVEFVANAKKPDFIYTHLTCITENFNLSRFLSQSHKLMPEYPLIASGNLTQGHHGRVPEGVKLKKSLGEVVEFIEEL
ncbi:MAG: MerR family transcriptional regulator [Chitinophagaceae bacterium]|nr:MAG: MerR family transcriptional regulator [Chitinophagaceae bacterium]